MDTVGKMIEWLQRFDSNKEFVVKLGNQAECTIDDMFYSDVSNEVILVVNPEQNVKIVDGKYEQ